MDCNTNNIFSDYDNKPFNFNCYKGIPCFNKCCAGLKLILTPYDILQIKTALGISSDNFLNKYTNTIFKTGYRFPFLKLAMNSEKDDICHFVTDQGCSIYDNRPAACRLYPIGRAATTIDGEENPREKYFFVREKHCLGFKEDKSWTINEWINHEKAGEYIAMNDQWLNIITASKTLGKENAIQKIQMFYMASYNTDKFRSFIFGSNFFHHFKVTSALKESLAHNDIELLKFGFKWLRFSLFGDKSILSDQCFTLLEPI